MKAVNITSIWLSDALLVDALLDALLFDALLEPSWCYLSWSNGGALATDLVQPSPKPSDTGSVECTNSTRWFTPRCFGEE